MNLEEVEQRSLNYLKQTRNPLVKVRVLLEHVQQEPGCEDLDEGQLLSFLRKHELFRVIEPQSLPTTGDEHDALAALGVDNEPRVILITRVPSSGELPILISGEMENLVNALQAALREAQQSGQEDKAEQLLRMVHRTQDLQQRLAEFEDINNGE